MQMYALTWSLSSRAASRGIVSGSHGAPLERQIVDAPGRVVDLYRAVLIEAASPQDLYACLDAGMLRRLWALMWLPAAVRRAWELRFPVLAEISRVTATA
jgi:hypothetical protein